jgi:hypothetical protein
MLKLFLRQAAPPVVVWLALSSIAHATDSRTVPASAPAARVAPFDQYQSFRDEPVGDWRETNARVREAGGWRAYLKESHQDSGGTVQAPHGH